MSNLLSQASLVMIPSGYKEDVVYSQIPTNGNGDLSFTRASNGTRINSAGLVEVCPWNLVQQSETFNSVTWNKANTTITANDTTAPNGTTTADKFAPNGTLSSTYFSISQEVVSGATSQAHTAIIYAKAGGLTQILMYLGNSIGVYWNLSNGQFISYYSGAQTITNYSSEAVGDGWYKYTISISVNSGSTYLEVYGAKSGAFIGNYTTSDNCYIWGAQLNIGSTAKPYFPTTDRLNVPRLTYQNGGGGCPSLLLEKQSTNVAYYSNDLATAPNVVDASTTTANVYVSPDGTQNAMRFTETTVNDRHGFYQYTTVTAQTYTASIFTKQTGRRYISFLSDMKGVTDAAYFDLQTKTAINVPSGYSCSVEDFGNGWLRLIVTFTATAGTRYVIWGGSPDGSSTYYAGNTSISQTFYGYQLEAGSYATSYIPTTSSSATRVADACSKTGISSLIGQTQGVLFVDFVITGTTGNNRFSISDGSNTNWIFIGTPEDGSNGGSRFYIKTNGSVHVDVGVASYFTIGQRYKLAIAYKSGDWAVYGNGVQLYSGTTAISAVSSALSQFNFFNATGGNADAGEQVNQAILFPTRLTNAELASLTTI